MSTILLGHQNTTETHNFGPPMSVLHHIGADGTPQAACYTVKMGANWRLGAMIESFKLVAAPNRLRRPLACCVPAGLKRDQSTFHGLHGETTSPVQSLPNLTELRKTKVRRNRLSRDPGSLVKTPGPLSQIVVHRTERSNAIKRSYHNARL